MPLPGPITRFYSDDQIAAVTNDMLRDVRGEVQLVSPWIGANQHSFDRILDCVQNGVKVTLFCRPRTEKDPNHLTAVDRLAGLGVEILEDPALHAKMLIIDHEEILLSSANLVYGSQVRNHETGIWTEERQIVEDALSYLDTLRKRIEAAPTQYCRDVDVRFRLIPRSPIVLSAGNLTEGHSENNIRFLSLFRAHNPEIGRSNRPPATISSLLVLMGGSDNSCITRSTR